MSFTKAVDLLRLAKASATFAGGLDYLAWKINRHAGTRIAIQPWQRRWPIIGALVLLPLTLALNWRLGLLLIALVVVFVVVSTW